MRYHQNENVDRQFNDGHHRASFTVYILSFSGAALISYSCLREEDFDCQRTANELVDGIRKQIRWLSFGAEPNLFVRYHPLRPFIHWYYGSKVNSIVSRSLDDSFETFKKKEDASSRSIVNLAFNAFISGKTEGDLVANTRHRTEEMEPFFKKICLPQIKLFLFSGHDTTSSSICYTLYLLSKHPAALKAVQQELDTVFSADPTQISRQISENPHLLNNLPYITAVIKESLRLFPTVSSTRDGEPNFSVTDAQGRNFPTENFLVWVNPHAVQHSTDLWDAPEEFIPERWLGERRKEIKRGAWRSFEHGPRNCIGQELAMIESKIVLCLVVRDFVVRDDYKTGGKDIHGEKAYQVQLSQPARDLPCRIERV